MGGFAGTAGSWWQPPRTIVARRAIVAAAVAAPRDRICALAGIKVLLLPQSSFKISSRGPERKQSLSILVLRRGQRRLLLQQVAKQNCLLRATASLVPKPFLFCIPAPLPHRNLCSPFIYLPHFPATL